jgi:dolichol-phosphate mannosyltransferase
LSSLSASIVIPAYNEVEGIQKTIELLAKLKIEKFETLIVVDSIADLTIKAVESLKVKPRNLKILVQNYGTGPANAIRFGVDNSKSECVIVMMADGSDDVRVIPELLNLINRGVVVACPSRYMSGGQQIGGPRMKKFLSKFVGHTLYFLAGVGTHDPTNNFKAYSRGFVEQVGIDSRSGFEIGIELVAKARRCRLPVAEIPTIWLDRTSGTSHFKILKWAPKYLRWYFYSFGREIQIKKSDKGA